MGLFDRFKKKAEEAAEEEEFTVEEDSIEGRRSITSTPSIDGSN